MGRKLVYSVELNPVSGNSKAASGCKIEHYHERRYSSKETHNLSLQDFLEEYHIDEHKISIHLSQLTAVFPNMRVEINLYDNHEIKAVLDSPFRE